MILNDTPGSCLYKYSSAFFRSGFKVVTTCSPRNFDLVKDLGADLILDYVSS